MDMSLNKFRELVMDREAWCAAVHGVVQSWTWLSDWSELIYHGIVLCKIPNETVETQFLNYPLGGGVVLPLIVALSSFFFFFFFKSNLHFLSLWKVECLSPGIKNSAESHGCSVALVRLIVQKSLREKRYVLICEQALVSFLLYLSWATEATVSHKTLFFTNVTPL